MPTGSPASAAAALAAEVSTTGIPAPVAIRADSTLVTIPPDPRPALPVEPIRTASRSAAAVTSLTRVAGPVAGLPS